MPKSAAPVAALETFLEEEWITRVLHVVKSGKEATVYCCEASPSSGSNLVAAKVYRPRRGRGFQNDAVYHEGRAILDSRVRRAVQNKTRRGREFQFNMWVGHEWETLSTLHAAGADVPRPLATEGDAILMEYLGDADGAAAPLYAADLRRDEARPLFERIMENVELFLSRNLVHGDLSPFNILYWRGTAWIIDFPQAVDPRFNRNGFELLLRDIEHVCDYFAAYGVRAHPQRLARDLWDRFSRDQL